MQRVAIDEASFHRFYLLIVFMKHMIECEKDIEKKRKGSSFFFISRASELSWLEPVFQLEEFPLEYELDPSTPKFSSNMFLLLLSAIPH